MRSFSINILLLAVLGLAATSFGQKPLVELPMKKRGLMPAVEVWANGTGPYIFAIDTGAAGKLRVDLSLMAKLQLKPMGNIQAGDGIATRTRDVVKVDSLKIGPLEFTSVEGITGDYNRAPNLPKIDGILGFNLFEEYLLTLDFPGNRVLVAKGELEKPNGRNVLAYEADRGVMIVPLLVGGTTVKAHIDTGNLVAPFVLPTEVVEKAAMLTEPTIAGRARTQSGEYEIKRVQLKDTIKLGSLEFPEPKVSFPALSAANMGSAAMQDLILSFDQKNKRVKIERIAPAKAVK